MFDLFGQSVDPARLNLTGAMPPGPLRLVLPAGADRRRSKKGKVPRRREPPAQVFRLAPRHPQTSINLDQAVFATHLVKSGNRLLLRHY